MIGINSLSWLDLKTDLVTKPITNCKQQLLKRLFNICLPIEVNHITSQPSLPKKIKSPPQFCSKQTGTWDVLAGCLPYESWNLYSPGGSPLMCLCSIAVFLLLPVFGSSCLRNRIVCIHSSRRSQFIDPFLLTTPKQTYTPPSCQVFCPRGRPFLPL